MVPVRDLPESMTEVLPNKVADMDMVQPMKVEAVKPEPKNALPAIPSDNGAVQSNSSNSKAKFSNTHTVLFAFAKLSPENPAEFEAYIGDLVNKLKANPKRKVLLQGYTDDTAAKENNLELAMRRCNVIADLLKEKGISEGQIVKEALGEANPVATNDTQAGRRLNRRVEISIQE